MHSLDVCFYKFLESIAMRYGTSRMDEDSMLTFA
jgi:hypothetical protein